MALASASSTRLPRSASTAVATAAAYDAASADAETATASAGRASAKRAVKWNVLPRPGSLSTHRRPFISPTSWEQIASPRPVPP